MMKLSLDVRRQIVELGQRSRPLGDARAQQLAASLVLSLVQELRADGDGSGALRHYRNIIESEIQTDPVPPREAPNQKRTWADLLPEYR
jgi:hypothetical protein